jgi:hypothetical protein
MTDHVSTASNVSPAVVRSRQRQYERARLRSSLARWMPWTALIGASAYALAAHPLFLMASTYGHYWRP